MLEAIRIVAETILQPERETSPFRRVVRRGVRSRALGSPFCKGTDANLLLAKRVYVGAQCIRQTHRPT